MLLEPFCDLTNPFCSWTFTASEANGDDASLKWITRIKLSVEPCFFSLNYEWKSVVCYRSGNNAALAQLVDTDQLLERYSIQ
jgi:hypothetical protein